MAGTNGHLAGSTAYVTLQEEGPADPTPDLATTRLAPNGGSGRVTNHRARPSLDARPAAAEADPLLAPVAPRDEIGGGHRLAHSATRLILRVLRVAVPLLVGAAAAGWIALQPVEVNLGIPGMNAVASIQTSDYFSVQYGPTRIGLVGPGNYRHVLGHDISVNVEVTRLDTSAHRDLVQQSLAGLVNSSGAAEVKRKLEDSIMGPVERQFGFAAGVGFGIFAGLMTAAKAWRLKRKRHRAEVEMQHAAVSHHIELLRELNETSQRPDFVKMLLDQGTVHRSGLEKRLRAERDPAQRIGLCLVGLVLVAASTTALSHEYAHLHPPASEKHYLTDSLSRIDMGKHAVSEYPQLKQIFVTGDVGYYAHRAVEVVMSYTDRYDRGWKAYADHFVRYDVPKLKRIIPKELQEDPDIVRITTIADVHDNQPALKEAMPKFLRGLGTDLVLNLGDQESNGGQSFLDFGAWLRAANALPISEETGRATPAFLAPGNHDHDNYKEVNDVKFVAKDGSEYRPIIPLDEDNKYSATFDGIVVVGSPDLNSTGVNGTFPRGLDAQLANDAKQGAILAKRACEIYETTGQRPIVIAHERWATYQAILQGCASLAVSGHGHEQMPLNAFVNRDGSLSFQQTIGSASGDGPNNEINVYNLPTITGYMVTWLYSKELNRPVGAVVTHIYPRRMPSVEYVSMPDASMARPPLQDRDIYDFLHTTQPQVLRDVVLQHAQAELSMTPQ